jgi:hypothetical protein
LSEGKTKMSTIETLYEAYLTANKNEVAAQEQLKTLRIAGEAAATFTRRNAVGTMSEKLAAIAATWAPFTKAIAETETAIAACYIETENAYAAYDKARIEA